MRIRLRHQRLEKELARSGRSQNAWALALGLDSGHLSKLVNGQRRYPGAQTRRKLLEGLGLEFDELFVVESGPRRSRPCSRPEPVHTTEAPVRLGNDFRYALRMMRKRPGFSVLIVLIVALGVGANSAVLGVVDAVLLSPLPFPGSERLVLLSSTDEARGGGGAISFPDYLDWADQSRSFEALAAFQEESFILGGEEGAERVAGEMVTPEYFRLLGVEAVWGRTPTVDELETMPEVVVLGEALVERRFGDPEAIVGDTIDVNDESFLVIGVLPTTFQGFSGEARIWVPMRAFDAINPDLVRYDILDNRGTRWHRVLGRLRDEVELEEAEAEMRTIAAGLSEVYPRSNESRSVQVRYAHDEVVSDHRASLWMLSAAVGVLLLLACVNLANLFWLRVLSRRDEVAVRMALGASRARLARQLLTETALFSVCGGVVAILVARFCTEFLLAFSPLAPNLATAGSDVRIFTFALILSAVTGIAFGLVPALSASRAEPASRLSQGSRAAHGGRGALAGFAFSEIAIATLLLIGAGLVLKSFHKMQRFDPGFESDNLLTMQFHVPRDVSSQTFLERIETETAALPGVELSAITSHVYFGQGYMSGDVTVEGFEPATPADEVAAYWQYVGDDYFRTMGIPLIEGELFGASESEHVAVVNQSFAEKMWPDGAIGKRLARGSKDPTDPWLTIVGVVGDVVPRLRLAEADRLPQIYFPVRDGGWWSRRLVLRTVIDPATVVSSVRAALRELHSGTAIFAIATMDELLSRQRASLRYVAYLMGGFSVLALFLAALGLYGVIAYAVRQLTREIGIRIAVGASRRNIVGLVMKPAAFIIGIGLAVGLLASLGATRFAGSLLYEVDPLDAGTFVAVVAGLTSVALLASYLPARRASRVDPVEALRHE